MAEDVKFNEAKIVTNPLALGKPSLEGRLVAVVKKISGGTIKDDKQARYAVIAALLVILIFSVYLLSGSFSAPSLSDDLKLIPAE